MTKKIALLFAVATLALAGVKSYPVTFPQAVQWGNTELKAGQYKMELADQKAVIRAGKLNAEVPVKAEEGDQKYSNTTMRIVNEGGKAKVVEICIGGTKTKLSFND